VAGGWVLSFIRLGIPRFRAGSTSKLKYEAVSLTVCVALLVTSLELPVQDGRLLTPEQRISELDRSLRALADGEREMPRDTWDPDYVVRMVGRDPQRLFRWVQQNTYWIPYHGVLRGSVGVLMDRQGNSLDRAILLATLLEKAGYTVRLAHGEISREDAAAMLPQLVSEQSIFFTNTVDSSHTQLDVRLAASQYGLDRTRIEHTLNAHAQAADSISAQLDSRVAEQTKRLLGSTKPTSSDQEWVRRFKAAIASLCDHWWVQVQDSDHWVDLDLLVGDGSRSVALSTAKETFAPKGLSANLYHQIAIRVIAEQWSGGAAKETTTLEHVFRPADVVGQPIILQCVPIDWLDQSTTVMQPAMDIRKEAVRQKAWAATLMVGHDDVASGTLHDTGEKASPQKGGPFGFGNALTQTLNQGSSFSSNKILSAVWLEYEIRVPGESPRVVRRTVFDLLGADARASGASVFQLDDAKKLTRALSLSMKTEILPIVCQLSPEFVAHLTAEPFNADQELLSSMMKSDFSADSEKTKQQLAKAKPPVSPLVALAFTRLEWNHASESVLIDRPNILTRHQYLTATPKGIALQNAIDIVANEVGVNLSVPDAFSVRLQQGVRDTNNEALLYGGGGTGNTADAFADSHNWLTIARAQRSAIQDLSLAENTKLGMAQDIDAGYLLVATKSAVHRRNEDFVGWWRINPETGDALGIAENGWGQELPEEEVNIMAAMRFAQAFLWENVACHAYAQALNSVVIIKELVVGDWHPSWTTGGAQSKDPSQVYKESQTMCLLQAIAAGFLATAPLLLLTLRNNRRLRALRALEAAEDLRPRTPPRDPCPPIVMAPIVGHLPLASFYFYPLLTMSTLPCVPGGGPGPHGGGPHGPNEPGSATPKDANPDPQSNPPKEPDPCDETGGARPDEEAPGTKQDPSANPQESEGPQPRETVQEAKDNLWAAAKAYDDAQTQSANALGDLIRYRVNKPSVAERLGGDPSKFDPAEYERLQKIYDEAKSQTDARFAEWQQAKQAYKNAQMAQAAARGQAGRSGLGCGWGPSPQAQSPAGAANQVSSGGENPGVGANPNGPGTGPGVNPAGNGQAQSGVGGPSAPGDQLSPSMIDPNGPPTVRDPVDPYSPNSGDHPTINNPYKDPAHAPTQPMTPPGQQQINVNGADPRNPTMPAQKAVTGIGGVLGALGGK